MPKVSYLWRNINTLRLRTNVRIQQQGNPESTQFASLLLDIGDGKLLTNAKKEIQIPDSLCKIVGTINDLISTVYPHLQDLERPTSEWFCQHAILSPQNNTSAAINNAILDQCNGEKVMYKSIDTTLSSDDAVNHPVEFLNSVDFRGLPPHKLNLKLHAPIMLLRNLDAPQLCNGTRLRIVRLRSNVIEAEILTGCAKGEIVFIPRIPMIPQGCPYEFKRLQFPVKLCFAMTINKAQGQTLCVAGIDLQKECFSNGQLYVACSRVTGPDGLTLLVSNGQTTNICSVS